jgi:hypothetical protein
MRRARRAPRNTIPSHEGPRQLSLVRSARRGPSPSGRTAHVAFGEQTGGSLRAPPPAEGTIWHRVR